MFNTLFKLFQGKNPIASMREFLDALENMVEVFDNSYVGTANRNDAIDSIIKILESYKTPEEDKGNHGQKD